MTLLSLLFVVAALVWGLVIAKRTSLTTNCLLVVLVGVVLGHPFFHKQVGPLPITLDRVLWGLLLIQFTAMAWMRRTELKAINRTDMIVMGLAVLLVISTFTHDWHFKDNRALSRLLFFNLIPIGIYFVAKHSRLRSIDLTWLFLIFFGFGVYLSVTAIAEQREWTAWVFPRFILSEEYTEFLGRARGPFLNPVSCGIYLTICLSAAAMFWTGANWKVRVVLSGFAIVCLSATFLTLTRSVWVGTAWTVFCLMWFPATRFQRGALISFASIAFVVFAIGIGDRLNSFKRDRYVTVEEMSQSASLRPMLAHVAFKMFEDKPVFGHGFGQYGKVKGPYHYEETEGQPLRKVLPYMQHNVFLSYLTETGLVGLALLVGILASIAMRGWQIWNSTHLPRRARQLGLIAVIFVGNYAINGMFHDVSIIPHIGALLFLIAGLIENVAQTDWEQGKQAPTASEPDHRLAA